MFGPAGHLYVYRIYGIHWCMNVVTQPVDVASAVLLRAGEVVTNTADFHASASVSASIRGPGNLTTALGVSGDDDGRDCCAVGARITFHPGSAQRGDVVRSARIGITKAPERMSRYYLAGSLAVSKATRSSQTPA